MSAVRRHTDTIKQHCHSIAARSKHVCTKFHAGYTTISNHLVWTSLIVVTGIIGILAVYSASDTDTCFPRELEQHLQEAGGGESGGERWELELRNEVVVVRNLAAHGPVTPRTPVLVVLVHAAGRLRALLAALEQLAGADDLLLVLSHARPPRAAPRLRCCMLVHIYYPHAGVASALHWWWTAHYVYEYLLPQLLAGRPHAHLVLFLDDSCMVLPDLAHVAALAHLAWAGYFPDVAAVSLGGPPSRALPGATFTVEAWRSSLADGLGLRRDTWRRLVQLRRHYCERAAPDWAGALTRVFANFPGGRALVLRASSARVLRGPPAQLCARTRRTRLFPRRVRAVLVRDRAGAVPLAEQQAAPEMAWSSPDDLALCFNISNSFITERRKRPRIRLSVNAT